MLQTRWMMRREVRSRAAANLATVNLIYFFSFYIFDLFCIISLFFFCSFHLARLQPSSLFTTWKLEIYILANHLLKKSLFTVCVTFHIIISNAFNFRGFHVIWSI